MWKKKKIMWFRFSQNHFQFIAFEDRSKKRAHRVKPIKERDEETNLIKTWVHDLPWSNIQKTFSSTIDHKLAEAKQQRWSENTGMICFFNIER